MNPYEYRDENEHPTEGLIYGDWTLVCSREVFQAIAPQWIQSDEPVQAIVYTGNAFADQVIDDHGDLDEITKQELTEIANGPKTPDGQ